ncbi:MAG: Ig-like domain-containing protein [Phycisphaerae bacterium]
MSSLRGGTSRLVLLAIVTTVMIGGCPQNVDLPNTGGDDAGPLPLFGQSQSDPNNSNGNPVGGAGTNNGLLVANDMEYAIRKGASLNLVFHNPAENPSGVRFRVIEPPSIGALGDVEQIGENRAQVMYTPPFTFSGIIRFRYVIEHEDEISDLAEVAVAVYPELRFSVLEDDSENGGVIRASAFTQSGEPLPQANFYWHIDNREIASELVSHQMIDLDPGAPGMHDVGLFAQYAGTTIRVAASAINGSPTIRTRTSPRIFGVVNTTEGVPVRDIRVVASGTQTMSTRTDANGRFTFALAAGWSGDIRVQTDNARPQPPRYSINDLRQNIDDMQFVVSAAGTPTPAPLNPETGDPIAPDAGDRSFELFEDVPRLLPLADSAETQGTAIEIEIVSLPSRGVLRDPTTGTAIFSQQLPYVLAEDGESVEYIPAPNAFGADDFEFRYRVQTSSGLAGVVNLSVLGQNDDPGFTDGSRREIVTSLNVPKTTALTAVDVDANGAELVWQVANNPQHGTVSFEFDRTASGQRNRVTYHPQAGYAGTDQFSIRCLDRLGASAVVDFGVTVSSLMVVAHAGNDVDAVGFEEVTLSGAESLAPAGAAFAWRQVGGPFVEIGNSNRESIQFRVPPILEETELEFELLVTSGGISSTDRVKVRGEYRRQSLVYAFHAALERHWNTRVDFNVNGVVRSGFASTAAIDGDVGFWGNESGAPCSSPLWDFQGRSGVGGMLFTYVAAYQATGNKHLLRRANLLGDALLETQDALGGGWYQDAAYVNGQWQNVGVWGPFGNNFHTPANYQGFFTLDDSTSQGCALALLRLFEAGGDLRYLAGARRFGDHLVNLKDIQYQGSRPYANGGIPQALPLSRALVADHNQNADPRSPDGPYMPHKTLNDNMTSDALIFLMELYRVTGDERYATAVRLNVDYLLERHAAYGYRGWAQQYHFLTDAIAWGRHKEPPAFVTCENKIVDALLLWRQRENDADRIENIENAIQRYIEWLRDDLERPADFPTQVWRYYNHDSSVAPMNEVVFANDFIALFGAANESNAGAGQPYRGVWDLKWAGRLHADQPGGVADLSYAANYLGRTADDPSSVTPSNWQNAYTRQDVRGAWPKNFSVGGRSRTGLSTSDVSLNAYGLVNRVNYLSEPLIDADADGFDNDVEIAAGSDPYDSASVPQQ